MEKREQLARIIEAYGMEAQIDMALDCCKECKDWAYGEQPTIDLTKARENK